MKDYMEDTLGNYVGIGIYMTADKKQDKVKVISPIKGSPAEKSRNRTRRYNSKCKWKNI